MSLKLLKFYDHKALFGMG